MSGLDKCPAVVSADWLEDALKTDTNTIRVLDVTWSNEKDEHQAYLASHISGAGYFNLKQGVLPNPFQPFALPSPAEFTRQAQGLGINADTHVVVYDRTEGKCGFYKGSRVWLMFKVFGHDRVSVLDGGMSKWTGSVDDVVPVFEKGNFSAEDVGSLIWTFEDVQNRLDCGDFQLVDTRPPPLFKGTPSDSNSGHLPGAINIPLGRFLDAEKGQLKSKEQLNQLLQDSGIDLSKMSVGMCNCGIGSATFILTLYLLGAEAAYHLYLGGYVEWYQRCSPGQLVQS